MEKKFNNKEKLNLFFLSYIHVAVQWTLIGENFVTYWTRYISSSCHNFLYIINKLLNLQKKKKKKKKKKFLYKLTHKGLQYYFKIHFLKYNVNPWKIWLLESTSKNKSSDEVVISCVRYCVIFSFCWANRETTYTIKEFQALNAQLMECIFVFNQCYGRF